METSLAGKSIRCERCAGNGVVASWTFDGPIPDECPDCEGSGRNWQYPRGAIAKHYGGPLIGRSGAGAMTTLPDLEPAALDAAPRGYLFELCYSHEHDRWSGPMYSECLPDAADVRNIVPLYAARSVPEAGKAVDETLTALAGFLVFLKDMRFTGSWDLPTLDRAIEVGETIAEQQSALASVPAPSGATNEPVAQLGGAPDDLHNLMKVVFADMTVERLNEVCKEVLARRNPNLARLEDRLTASEAEATSLRRKLEEVERDRDEAREIALNFTQVERFTAMKQRAEAAERKMEEHRKALEPFAVLANDVDQMRHEDDSTCLHRIRAGDLRRARALSDREGQE